MMKIFETTHQLLHETDEQQKLNGVRKLHQSVLDGIVDYDSDYPVKSEVIGALPLSLKLVPPREVQRRRLFSPEGKAAMIHAICHIEYNAINIALEAVYRFREMPQAYYLDWLNVAAEEAYHYGLLHAHLNTYGYEYGDFTAHNSLWEMTEKTSHDVLHRMALVPRLLEARGLDVTPDIAKKMLHANDTTACEILSIIFHDEINHVRVGNRWYAYICEQRSICPIETFAQLLNEYAPTYIRGPISEQARLKAGFKNSELKLINELIALRSQEKTI
jgi:uncharacterized ferritin-like protein (DUF455 family)